jgi:hypothetical protein
VPLTPRTLLGRYEITALFGEGAAWAKVFRTHHTALSRTMSSRYYRMRLRRTLTASLDWARAQVLVSLNHPNIAHVNRTGFRKPSWSIALKGTRPL